MRAERCHAGSKCAGLQVGSAIEGIEQRAADGLLHEEVAGCPDRNEFDTDPSTESEQHDRKGDRHPLPAAQDLVEVRVRRLVVVVDVAAKAETVVDEHPKSLDIARGRSFGPGVEQPEVFADVDGCTWGGR